MDIKPLQRKELAQRCGIADAYLYQILSGRREASPELCVVVERESEKQITRQQLRPNDWRRIWPELSEASVISTEATQGAAHE